MDEAAFWALIGTTRRTGRIGRALARLAPDEITGFADQLAHRLRGLDTPRHAAAAGPAGADAFLAMRCAVVLAGHEAYTKVLHSPERMGRYRDEDAEPLLSVAEEAYEESTGRAWDHEPPVDIESGTGPAWGSTGEPAPAPPAYWLSILCGSAGSGRPSREYEVTLALLEPVLNADPAWQDWWRAAGTATLEIHLVFDPDLPPEQTVRRGRKLVRVRFIRPAPGFTAGPSDPERFRSDLHTILDFVRAELGLPDPPAVPPAPELPADIWRRG